jgi:hypothetical protein
MQNPSPSDSGSKLRKGLGLTLTVLVALFLAFDGVTKVFPIEPVIKASAQLGLAANTLPGIGGVLLLCTVIYLIPRTAVLGAVLLTGYLGGAIAIQVRAAGGAFPIVFALVFGGLIWLGLFLREPRLAGIILQRR